MAGKNLKIKITIGATLIAFIVVFALLQNVANRYQQERQVGVINSYIEFQDDVEAIVYNNVTLVNGYLAYIKSDHTVTQEKTNEYLDHLIKGQAHYIRNIGIIEDTTIVWNYPLEGNEASIGVDLAKVEGQREVILQTKNMGLPIFQGPVNLVQGGIGFIVRMPIDRAGSYWGQVSIVIDGDAFYSALERIAMENGIEVALYNVDDFPQTAFYETVNFNDSDAIAFTLSVDLIDWMVKVGPVSESSNLLMEPAFVVLVSIFSGCLVGLITYRQLEIQENVRYQADHDFLTGLYNRNYFDNYQQKVFEEAKEGSRMLAVMVIDINKFKGINDRYGHAVGDQVLKWVANKLRRVTEKEETVFRLGGDEFLIAFPKLERVNDLVVVMKRLEAEMLEVIPIKEDEITLTLSIGYAVYPADGDDIDALIKIADKMMYEQKNA